VSKLVNFLRLDEISGYKYLKDEQSIIRVMGYKLTGNKLVFGKIPLAVLHIMDKILIFFLFRVIKKAY